MCKQIIRLQAVFLVLSVLFLPAAWGQYTTGSIVGQVSDSSGAIVAGAQITLRSLATDEQRSFITKQDGLYVFPALLPGGYQLTVSAKGFREVHSSLRATSSATVTENIVLRPAGASTDVTVYASTAQLNLTDTQQTTTRDEAEIASLPIQTRNPQGMSILEPAVTPAYSPRSAGATLVAISGAQTGQIAAYGGRVRATAYSLDYTDINDWEFGGFALGTQPSMNLLTEVKVLTGVYPVEFGLQSSNLIAITRSGNSHLHGEGYDFIQNDYFNARDYFDTTGKATADKQNIYGFNLGGPVLKNRIFFFGGFETNKTRGAGTVVSLQMPNTNALAQATDATSAQMMKTLIASIPAPSASNMSGTITPVSEVYAGPADVTQYLLRGDLRFSPNHTANMRLLHNDGTTVLPYPTLGAPVGYGANMSTGTDSVNIGDTYILGSNKVNELRLAYGRSTGELLAQATGTQLTPRFNITGVINLGEYTGFPQGRIFNVYQISDAFTWVRGKHNFKFGADVRYIQDHSTNESTGRGSFTFSNLANFLSGTFSTYSQTFGQTARDYRTYIPGFFAQDDWRIRPTLTVSAGIRYEPQGPVTEKNGRVSLLDLSQQGVVIGQAGTGAMGAFRTGTLGIDGQFANFEPRVSFAWNPGASKLVVRGGYGIYFDDFNFYLLSNIRVAPPWNYTQSLSAPNATNTFDELVAGTGAIQIATAAQIGSFGSLTNFGAVNTVPKNLTNPMAQNFNFGLQYQVLPKTLLSLDYLGSVTHHLTDLTPLNVVQNSVKPTPAVSAADEVARLSQFKAVVNAESGSSNNRLDSRFNEVDQYLDLGSSNYNALAVKVQQTAWQGLTAQFSYTYSKSLDNDSDFAVTQLSQDLSYPQGVGSAFRSAEYGPSDFDITHHVVFTGLWKVPYFNQLHGVQGALLKGWSLSSVAQWQSGVPASIMDGSRQGITDVDLLGSVVNSQGTARASLNPTGHGFSLSGAHTTYNTGTTNPFTSDSTLKYIPTYLGNTGTLGRDTFRMPSMSNVDASLEKNTTLTREGRLGSNPLNLGLRLEAYNLFNLPFLTATGSNWYTLSSSAFGLVNTAGATRRIQLEAKFNF